MTSHDPQLPLDPDLDDVEDRPHHVGAAPTPRTAWPRLPGAVLAAVFAGGCLGGLVRYAVVRAWPEGRYDVPWSTLAVNVAGSFVLAVVVVAVTRRRWHPLARPLLGAGFCGALTTFSSFAVATDEMVRHDHLGRAAVYLMLTVVASLVAAVLGFLVARRVVPSGAAAG
jgi:fluoride exporter